MTIALLCITPILYLEDIYLGYKYLQFLRGEYGNTFMTNKEVSMQKFEDQMGENINQGEELKSAKVTERNEPHKNPKSV